MYNIVVDVSFDAAHRLLTQTSRCYHNHGHTYHAWVTLEGEALGEGDMLLDFGVIKRFVRDWIQEHWDHAYLCHQEDPLRSAVESLGLRCYVFSQNPTAEVMARHLYDQVRQFLSESGMEGLRVVSVKIRETPTSAAIYREG